MANNIIIARLTELSGDLSPSPQASADELRQARAAIAAAAITAQADGFAPGARALAPSPVDAGTARAFAEIAQQVTAAAPSPQLIARRAFPTASVPAPDSGASEISGRAVSASFGPFVDRAGRPVWIDLFPVLHLAGVARAGSEQPFLYVDVPVGAPPAATLTLGPGSVWFNATALAGNTAPINGWCGLRIKGGTVNFGSIVSLTASPILVPAVSTVTLDLDLDPPMPTAGTGPGADARQAQLTLPAHVVIGFAAGGGAVTQADNGSLSAFGATVAMTLQRGPALYDAVLGRVQIPFRPALADFAAADSRSTLVTVSGSAPITDGFWSLPVTTSAPGALGPAAGDGGFALVVSDGLTVRWTGHGTPTTCGTTTILVEPGAITLGGLQASTPNIAQRIVLWNLAGPVAAHGELDVHFPGRFGFRFLSEAVGVEGFGILTALSANLDRPRTINDERFPFTSVAALVAYVQTAAGTFLISEGGAQQTPPRAQAIALKNLLLRTGNPLTFLAYGKLSGNLCAPGTLIWQFDLGLGMPILPDPYATNLAFNPRAATDVRTLALGTLTITITIAWQPQALPTLDFVVPGVTAAAPARAA
ncbi:MAG: hypothetical protein WA733_26190, partial [Methylocystis sp.]